MPTAFAILYEGGRGHALTDTKALAAPPGGFVWIDVVDPTAAELKGLAGRFGLHPVAIDDALTTGQLPKADPTGQDSLFVVTRTARRGDRQVEFGQIAIFVGPDHVISVSRDGAPARKELRTVLEQLPEMLEMGVDYILHGILGFATGSFIDVIDRLDDEVGDLEAGIPVAALDASRIAHLLLLRRHVKRMERMLKPMEEMGRKLAAGELPCIRPDLAIYFRDVVDRVQRAQSVCASVHDGLASVFEIQRLARTAADRCRHASARGLGRDPRRPDGDRRHLRHELPIHAVDAGDTGIQPSWRRCCCSRCCCTGGFDDCAGCDGLYRTDRPSQTTPPLAGTT